MRNARAILIAAVIVLAVAFVVYLSVRKKPFDVTGSYRVKVNGELTKTTAMVTGDATGFTLSMSGENDLHAVYEMTRSENDTYTVLEYSGVNKTAEYRLRASKKGLEGDAWVLPLGKIDVAFEKIGK